MGVDYIARKSAKKRKKKERQAVGKDGAATRERRRKKIRRLCQGVCYKPPVLTEEDKQWSDKENSDGGAHDSDIEEAVARANSHRDASTSGAGEDAADAKKQQLGQKKPAKKRKLADAEGGGGGAGGAGLSTSVQLLDPAVLAANARQAALKKLPPGAKADALEGFPPLLQAAMLSQHHVEPTPVQERCWPPALAGRDVQGVAEPGSGKTLAYLLPGLVRLQSEGHVAASRPEGPAMLVLLPTRELAQQVAAECRNLRAVTGLRTVCVFGGAPREEQAALLASKAPHVLVGTPGRLLDLVDGGELKLQGHVRYLVLDEADKMLSLGFKPQLDRLYELLLGGFKEEGAAADAAAAAGGAAKAGKKQRASAKGKAPAQEHGDAAAGQAAAGAAGTGGSGSGSASGARPQVLLFSATMPAEVAAAAAQWLRRPEVVHVSAGGANAISRTVTQVVHVCAEHKKPEKLLKHLGRIREQTPPGSRNPPRLLVFANRVKTVRFLATTLAKEGFKVAQLHGQRSQTERQQAVTDFKSGKAQVLVATDVAARGLHISALPYVVNYDFPARIETYVHRVGRTGRLAAYGHAYSFFTRNLAPLAPPLLELLQAHGQAVDPNLAALAAAWRVAEQKLGAAGAAAAAAAATRKGEEGPDGAGGGSGEGEDEDDDEGDAAAAEREEGGKLSLAEEVLGAADDLMEGLGSQDARAIAAIVRRKLTKQQQGQQGKGKDAEDGDGDVDARPGKKQRQEAAAPEAAAAGKRKGREGDAQLVPTTKEQQRAAAAQGGEGRLAAFLSAKTFAGRKPGYAFKKGPLGVGYYPDPAQQQQAAAGGKAAGGKAAGGKAVGGKAASGKAAPAAAEAAKRAKAGGAAAGKTGTAKAGAADKGASAWGLPSRNKPLIPVRHSDFLSDSDDDGGPTGGSGGGSDDGGFDSEPESDGAPPPRPAGTGAAAAARDAGAGSDGGEDSEEEFEGGREEAKKKYKPLPGRLRKKLAKARGQAAGKQQQQQKQQPQAGAGRGKPGQGRPSGRPGKARA